MMVYVARHELPSGARFLFNMYRHHSVLVMRGETASKSVFLHSKEGVTQGCLLAMVGYAILVLPLIQLLKKHRASATSIWYAGDGNAASTLPSTRDFFTELCNIGKDYGYFPEASKSILLARTHVTDRAKQFCDDNQLPFIVKNGNRYLGDSPLRLGRSRLQLYQL